VSAECVEQRRARGRCVVVSAAGTVRGTDIAGVAGCVCARKRCPSRPAGAALARLAPPPLRLLLPLLQVPLLLLLRLLSRD
jgi:hypothetical protein